MKMILCAVMVFTISIATAQSKKEQIENLSYKLDSLTTIINQERKDFSIAQRESNGEIFNLKDSIDNLSSLNQELHHNLSNADYIVDSLSIEVSRRQIKTDSLSLALDSVIFVANKLDGEYENVFAGIDYFSSGESINARYINEKKLTIGEYRYQVMAGQDEIYGWLKISKAESVSDWEGMWIGGPSTYVDIAGFFNEDYVNQVKFVKWVSSTSFILDIHVYPNYRRVKIDIHDMDNVQISELR